MKELAILLRCLQLFSHNAHNLVEKSLFFQDHAFLGELYSTYEDAYDGVIERIIGLTDSNAINLVEVQIAANENTVAVGVRDFGVGFDKETSLRVFDRFWRADPSRYGRDARQSHPYFGRPAGTIPVRGFVSRRHVAGSPDRRARCRASRATRLPPRRGGER